MVKIMFVCHGNICRSPMAEFLFRDMVKKAGREGEISCASSAVSAEEIWGENGSPVYLPVKALLSSLGISCEGKRAGFGLPMRKSMIFSSAGTRAICAAQSGF